MSWEFTFGANNWYAETLIDSLSNDPREIDDPLVLNSARRSLLYKEGEQTPYIVPIRLQLLPRHDNAPPCPNLGPEKMMDHITVH